MTAKTKREINKKQLFWIIPLFLLIGYMLGLYLGIPKHITIDYGDNMLKATENLKVVYNTTFRIDNTNCPDCNCDCLIKDINNMVCFDESKYNVIRRIQ